MINKKVLVLLGLVFVIIVAVALVRIFEDLPGAETLEPIVGQASAITVPIDFDWETYVQNYPDLGRAGINTEMQAKRHWVEYGKTEGRTYKELKDRPSAVPTDELIPPDFDWETYVNNYGDLLQSDIYTKEQAIEHWLKIGKKEGRTYRPTLYQPVTVRPDFDWQMYVNNYKDLQVLGINTKEKAIEHWLRQGKKEGRTYRKIGASSSAALFGFGPRQNTKKEPGAIQRAKTEAMEYWLEYWAKRTSSPHDGFLKFKDAEFKKAAGAEAMEYWLEYWSTRAVSSSEGLLKFINPEVKKPEEEKAMEYWLRYWAMRTS